MTLSPKNEFGASDIDIFDIKMGKPATAQYVSAAITSNLTKKLRVIESIRERLKIWHETPAAVQLKASGDAIFLVHGMITSRASLLEISCYAAHRER